MLDPQLVDQCIHFPCFAVDGSQPTPQEPAVETHIELVGDYHVYLSKRLVVASARLYGMVDDTELAEAQLQLVKRDAQIALLEGEIAELEPVRRALTLASNRYGDLEAKDEPVRKKAA